jgi:hypothetical protein
MSPRFRLISTALLGAAVTPALAQGIAWEQVDPAPQSGGVRATVYGYPSAPLEEPRFSPRSVVARADGAYLVLTVNGLGRDDEQLGFVLNPSWQRLRGYQVLRLRRPPALSSGSI